MEDIDIVLNTLRNMKADYMSEEQKTWDQAFGIIFNKVKTACESEVLMHRESETGMSAHIENFSERILRTILGIKRNIETSEIGKKANIEMLDNLIDTFSKTKEDTSDDISERRTSAGQEIIKIGERPKTQKEKRGL